MSSEAYVYCLKACTLNHLALELPELDYALCDGRVNASGISIIFTVIEFESDNWHLYCVALLLVYAEITETLGALRNYNSNISKLDEWLLNVKMPFYEWHMEDFGSILIWLSALGKIFYIFYPASFHLQNEDNNNTYLMMLLWGLKDKTYVKSLELCLMGNKWSKILTIMTILWPSETFIYFL